MAHSSQTEAVIHSRLSESSESENDENGNSLGQQDPSAGKASLIQASSSSESDNIIKMLLMQNEKMLKIISKR